MIGSLVAFSVLHVEHIENIWVKIVLEKMKMGKPDFDLISKLWKVRTFLVTGLWYVGQRSIGKTLLQIHYTTIIQSILSYQQKFSSSSERVTIEPLTIKEVLHMLKYKNKKRWRDMMRDPLIWTIV